MTLKILYYFRNNSGSQQWHHGGLKDIIHSYTAYLCHGKQRNKIKKQEASHPILVHAPKRGSERMIHSSPYCFDFAWAVVAELLVPRIVSIPYSTMKKRFFNFDIIQSNYYFDLFLICLSNKNWIIVILRILISLPSFSLGCI